MRRLGLLSLSVAYPGTLGPETIIPPVGFVFLIDNDGVYLTDEAGAYLIVPAT
jgi:hypothetical protein